MYGEPGDEYWVSERARVYLYGAEYSTRALEDMEPRVRERDSWMQAVEVFCNRGVAPALRSLARGKAFRLALLVLGVLVCLDTNDFDQGSVGYSKSAARKALTTARSHFHWRHAAQ